MNKIMVIGSLNMDMVIHTERLPRLGETILGSDFMTIPGGKGANQAVAAARLGGYVSMLGCVGSDIFGQNLINNLKVSKVDTSCIKAVDGVSTGVAVIVVKEGDNFIIVDPGANSNLSAEMIESREEEIKSSDILMVQMEIPADTVKKAVEIANRNGVRVLLNPAPAKRLSKDLLSRIDIITPNESESEIITGMTVKSAADAERAVRHLMDMGVPQVVITLGSNGAVYNNGGEIIHKQVRKVVAVDTTAAGDAFSGALAAALARGWSINDAVDFGNVAGALTVGKKGAQTSLPLLEEVMNFVKQEECQC